MQGQENEQLKKNRFIVWRCVFRWFHPWIKNRTIRNPVCPPVTFFILDVIDVHIPFALAMLKWNNPWNGIHKKNWNKRKRTQWKWWILHCLVWKLQWPTMIVLPWNGPETVACGKPTWVNFMQKYNLKYVHFDGCALGLKDKRGQFLRKPWCVATNDLRILQRFGQYIYPGNHEPMQGTNSLELSAILWLLRTQYDLNVGRGSGIPSHSNGNWNLSPCTIRTLVGCLERTIPRRHQMGCPFTQVTIRSPARG